MILFSDEAQLQAPHHPFGTCQLKKDEGVAFDCLFAIPQAPRVELLFQSSPSSAVVCPSASVVLEPAPKQQQATTRQFHHFAQTEVHLAFLLQVLGVFLALAWVLWHRFHFGGQSADHCADSAWQKSRRRTKRRRHSLFAVSRSDLAESSDSSLSSSPSSSRRFATRKAITGADGSSKPPFYFPQYRGRYGVRRRVFVFPKQYATSWFDLIMPFPNTANVRSSSVSSGVAGSASALASLAVQDDNIDDTSSQHSSGSGHNDSNLSRRDDHHRRNSGASLDDKDPSNLSNHGANTRPATTNVTTGKILDPPILVYHESARSIVFRDHLRRAARRSESSLTVSSDQHPQPLAPRGPTPTVANRKTNVVTSPSKQDEIDHVGTLTTNDAGEVRELQIAGFQPRIVPLPAMELGPDDHFQMLLDSPSGRVAKMPDEWTLAEREVVRLLQTQRCAVKTIKNVDWTSFLNRFQHPVIHQRGNCPNAHDDIPPDDQHHFNSFVTSTTMLPDYGQKMRCFGSLSQYTVGVVFGFPGATDSDKEVDETAEDEAAQLAQLWSWPAGYSAKTEFNIDSRGRLINGRQEALLPLSVLRQYNRDYLNKDEYMVGMRMVKGLNQIPYNELFLRVGGVGRLVEGKDCVTEEPQVRSFERGVGLPVALFVRSTAYGHLISLLRTRARMMHILGEQRMKHIPLLYITPDHGVRVLTKPMQKELWKVVARQLNPFQNTSIAHKTTIHSNCEASFQQKVEELLDLDTSIREMLTPQELARLAGGFGATDQSVAAILKHVMMEDRRENRQLQQKQEQPNTNTSDDKCNDEGMTGGEFGNIEPSHKLQDVVNEGLAAAVRAGDYHTSRQLLILYSLVASRADDISEDEENTEKQDGETSGKNATNDKGRRDITTPSEIKRRSSFGMDGALSKKELRLVTDKGPKDDSCLAPRVPPPPPPPPLDTDRLRSATNSDGLLAVLGAAQVLKAMQDGGAKKRVQEAISSVLEWVNYGEQSIAFRISSWYDQRAAQGDLKIATEHDTNLMAFVSNKAISNRKAFADQLSHAVDATEFNDVRFLQVIYNMLSRMHSPCLRLELLQYVLGLDNRYSVAHVMRSVELAATCLGISCNTTMTSTTAS